MTQLQQTLKSAAAFGILALGLGAALPAQAAQADIDYLANYVGNWKGIGKAHMRDGPETVLCNIAIRQDGPTQLKINGDCAGATPSFNFNGTVLYAPDADRFGIKMTSDKAFRTEDVARRNGQSLTFDLKNLNYKEGDDLDIAARLRFNGNNIEVNAEITQMETGGKITAEVPLRKK